MFMLPLEGPLLVNKEIELNCLYCRVKCKEM